MPEIRYALNHMAAPGLDLDGFMRLASDIGVYGVEVRNDLSGMAIADGTPPEAVKAAAARYGLTIHAINALYPFNRWDDERAAEARRLIAYAGACGARGIVMCPLNDPAYRVSDAERLGRLREALAALKPMLADAGVTGLIEPLGFPECSLRLKREAVEAVEAVDGAAAFALVHDTFHHHVAGEQELFADRTGLVHLSGVVDPAVARDDMRDLHRVLVDAADRLDNRGQVRALLAAGYRGPMSFEPFAPEVHALPDIASAVRASMDFVSGATA